MSISSASGSAAIANLILSKISHLLIKNNRRQHVYFCVEKELPVSAIDVTVTNVGKLQFPLVKEVIEKLISNSTEAKFEKGNETLLDKTVCDTNEIKADKLNVTINDALFKNMLSEMRQELGLPETTVLEPRLHNMLIYGPGQFFKMHKDREKADGMIASLVIVLPVEHTDGDLIVKHNQEKHVFFSEDIDTNKIKCTAFYADCSHKIEEVSQGHRIVLTYNLISLTKVTYYAHYSNVELEKLVNRYFNDKELATIDNLQLIYLLDHIYTEHSLKWNMLKGVDIRNGSAMYNAAQKLNLVPHLALIEISKTRSDKRLFLKYGPRFAHKEMAITFWIDLNNERLYYDNHQINSEFICSTVEAQNFESYFMEVEYGNVGYDVDFRYRRAAIILWPVSNDFRMKFIINYAQEKKEFFKMLEVPNRQEKAVKIIMETRKHLHDSSSLTKDNFVLFVDFAIKVDDRKVALELLSYFWWGILDLDVTMSFVQLKSKYTISFVVEMLEKWERKYECILQNICDIVMKLIKFDVGTELVEFILKKECAFLSDRMSPVSEHINEIKEILKACELAKGAHSGTVQTLLVDRLIDLTHDNFSVKKIVPLVLDLQKDDINVGTVWFERLKNYTIFETNERKILSYKPENDWSVFHVVSCKCYYCSILKQFFISKYKVKKILSCCDKTAYKHLRQYLKYYAKNKKPICITIEGSEPHFKVTLLKVAVLHCGFKDEFNKCNSYLHDLNAY